MSIIAKVTGPGKWADTSEVLSLAHYQYLALTGYSGCFRYIPRSPQGDPNQGPPISLQELQLALSVKCPDGSPFEIQFVQYARSNNVDAAHGTLDGQIAAAYMKTLSVPNIVCVWQDLASAAKADCIAYSNASYAAMMNGGIAPSAVGMYAEPGYPLSSEERYSLLDLHRYWATGADDPQKIVAHRGVQVIQGWASRKGEFSPIPGLVIDIDMVMSDFFGSFPVAAVAA